MNTISDDESVRKFCESIGECLRINATEKLDQLLGVLKITCRSPSICSSSLPTEEALAVLIQSRPTREYFKKHHVHCARLIGLFLCLQTLNKRTETCLKTLFDCLPFKGDHMVECSKNLSSHPDFYVVSVDLAVTVFKSYPVHFERQLLVVYSDPQQIGVLNVWARWSAHSCWFFQKLTSLLNEVLRIGPKTTSCLRVIDNLIRRTEIECESLGRDFVSLYPRSVQHLVVWMRCCHQSSEVVWPSGVLDYVKREYVKLKESQPCAALALLSHFRGCEAIL